MKPVGGAARSTVVAAAPQPVVPVLTANIHQSSAARRTTLGDTSSWFGARATSSGAVQWRPSVVRTRQHDDSSSMTWR